MTFKTLFIGLDYKHVEYRSLQNTIRMTKLIDHLIQSYNIDKHNYDILNDMNATYDGIISALYKLGLQTWSENLDYVLIYYIGDSINVSDYVHAYNGKFNIAQGIVPSDYNINGVIDKSKIFEILEQYNPNTKIIFIADSCFLYNNIFNLEYNWSTYKNNVFLNRPPRNTKYQKTNRKIMTISYSLSKYGTDDDNYYNILENNANIRSFADFVTKLGYVNDDIFSLLKDINNILNRKNIHMVSSLSASFDLTETDNNIFKCFDKAALQIPFVDFKPIQEDSFADYIPSYNNITDEIKQLEASVQPIQKIQECFC
jgi:hypothetical protein